MIAFGLSLVMAPNFKTDEQKPFDWVGFCYASGLLVSALVAMDELAAATERVGFLPYFASATLFFVLLTRHLGRCAHPLIDFSPMSYVTFRKTLKGGTIARILINALPFLLPLMFQLCMGYDALHAGLALTPLFAGHICIKPLTRPLIRIFGFRRILIVNGLFQATTMAACAFVSAGAPWIWIMTLLFLSGASRSLHYTALTTLTFADVPPKEMNMANLLHSTAFHVSFAFGVGLGAALVKFAMLFSPNDSAAAFHFAFLTLSALMVATVIDHSKLPPDAGHLVTVQ